VAITVAAGLFVGLAYAVLFSVWNELEFDPIQFAVLVVLFSWPTVPGVWIATDGDRRWSGAALAIYTVLMLALPAATPAAPLAGLVAWIWFNGPPTLVAAVFFTRSYRAIGICVLGVALAALIGSQVILTPLASDTFARLAADVGLAIGITDAGLLLFAVAAAGFLLAAGVGWLILLRLGGWYQRQGFSDHMLLLGSLCFVFCIDYAAVVAGSDPRALLAGLMLFAALAAGCLLAFRVVVGVRREPARLLLLRVFDHGRHGPRSLSRVAARWRFVGPVRMIAGPDLATTTVEPDEFLTFMGGRLRRLFTSSGEELESRLAELEPVVDPDGRFRVDEFFCFDTTWRAAVEALVERSEAVLLDLRGFHRERTGASEELGLLGRRGLFDRTVVIADGATDMGLVESIIAASASDRPTLLRTERHDPASVVRALLYTARLPVSHQTGGR
jgi:hypothetical protein